MDTISAMARALAAGPDARLRVFDWEKAARLIVERKPELASAGLQDDWDWTGGVIARNGDPVRDSYTYLASMWAIPEIGLDGELIDCWKYKDETPGWDSHTKWPPEALAILMPGSAVTP
jgi:hypothetical protein